MAYTSMNPNPTIDELENEAISIREEPQRDMIVCVCVVCVPWVTSFTTGPKADGSERYVSIAVAYARPGATPCDHIRREVIRTG
jgi:hypothetical protein